MKDLKLFENDDDLVRKVNYFEDQEFFTNHTAISCTLKDLNLIQSLMKTFLIKLISTTRGFDLLLRKFEFIYYYKNKKEENMAKLNLHSISKKNFRYINLYDHDIINFNVIKFYDEWWTISCSIFKNEEYNKYFIIDGYNGLKYFFKNIDKYISI